MKTIIKGSNIWILMMVVFLPIAFLPSNPPINAGNGKTILEVWDTKTPLPVALKTIQFEPVLRFNFRA